jgi:hypothetical protein
VPPVCCDAGLESQCRCCMCVVAAFKSASTDKFNDIPIRVLDQVAMRAEARRSGSVHGGDGACPLGITLGLVHVKTVVSPLPALALAPPPSPISSSPRRTSSTAAGTVSTSKKHTVQGIAVLQGLPRVQLCGVIGARELHSHDVACCVSCVRVWLCAAHELCHAYMNLRRYSAAIDATVSEGVCECWAFTYLSSLPQDDGSDVRLFLALLQGNTSPVYGDGFRMAAAALDAVRVDGEHPLLSLMKHLRRNRCLPRRR